jgi:uncharacterized LabA/DUF88 family protein
MSKVAVLVDYENIRLSLQGIYGQEIHPAVVAKAIAGVASDNGDIVLARVYGDWRLNAQAPRWFERNGFHPVLVLRKEISKRDRTDPEIVADAVEVALDNPKVDVFIIAAGDSDYSVIMRKLKERNKRVIIVAPTSATAAVLIKGCQFVPLEQHLDTDLRPRVRPPTGDGAELDFDWRPLILLIDKAERENRFVGLKRLRDFQLPDSLGTPRPFGSWGAAIWNAQRLGILEPHQVHNPRNPSYPTSAVRLDRSNALVRSVLSAKGEGDLTKS